MSLWTGCIAGALVIGDYRSRIESAGFVDVEIVPTLVHDRAALESLGVSIELPDEVDRERVFTEYDGAVANAFIRARRPQ